MTGRVTANTLKNEAENTGQGKPQTILKKIGATTYEISLHFSSTSRETMTDKILRLIKGEAIEEAVTIR